MKLAKFIGVKTKVKCPRCGAKLNRSRLSRTYVNRCSKGCGVWIDQHQLDQLAGTKSKRYEVSTDLPAQFLTRSGAI